MSLAFYANSQEMDFTVTVNTPKLQTADPKVFESLKTALRDFLNNAKWTDDVYASTERIKCNVQLTIKEEISATSFKAELAIQAVRPVYGSAYQTSLLTHVDKDVEFSYEPNQPLEFSRGLFNDNLTSILSFYVYVILGLDYDSFSLLGGDNYYQVAQAIVTSIPPDIANTLKGWRAVDSNRNRYWIIENLTNSRVKPYREALYTYHRKGLDVMSKDVIAGRASITKALEDIERVNKSYPSSMILQMFTNAKSEELIEIFKGGDSNQRTRFYQIMSKVDPAGASKYRAVGV
ncbi:MAG: DUF4835 family protein [Saprospiraceae bacterium]|nr:DUF4835 family protein [Saprospiraceae bacterium]